MNETADTMKVRAKAIAKVEKMMKTQWDEVPETQVEAHKKYADWQYEVMDWLTWKSHFSRCTDANWTHGLDDEDWSMVKRVNTFTKSMLYGVYYIQDAEGKWHHISRRKVKRARVKVAKDFNESDNTKLLEQLKALGQYGLVELKNAGGKTFPNSNYVKSYWCETVESLIERLSEFNLKDGGWSVVSFKRKDEAEGVDRHFSRLEIYLTQSKANQSNIDGEMLDAVAEGLVAETPITDDELSEALEKIVAEKTTAGTYLSIFCHMIAKRSNKNIRSIALALSRKHVDKANEAFHKISGGRSRISEREFSKVIHGSDEGWKLYCIYDKEGKRRALLNTMAKAAW